MRPLTLPTCRQQPTLMFVDGGALCGTCGREVAVPCTRSWLNEVWADEDAREPGKAMPGWMNPDRGDER